MCFSCFQKEPEYYIEKIKNASTKKIPIFRDGKAVAEGYYLLLLRWPAAEKAFMPKCKSAIKTNFGIIFRVGRDRKIKFYDYTPEYISIVKKLRMSDFPIKAIIAG